MPDESAFPQPISWQIASVLCGFACQQEEGLCVIDLKRKIPDNLRDCVLNYLEKNMGKKWATFSSITSFVIEIWHSIELELYDKFKDNKKQKITLMPSGKTLNLELIDCQERLVTFKISNVKNGEVTL